ncbi:reverse transcriptase domain-containing protein [Burkholderia thailandensis]|uniref:reverse transcriptase domain-containing protein n=1 Tax=Burkholderia thailandensis TaxID=57975 RepID=UPI0005728E99|nr:reverse transcriptase domain-containing protein [Burkholderia thailandensis]AVR11537.1 RNA-directed DNA polymerase [Burkholderia thailandensis]AWY58873.1 RNA-directed DNA polymerase [Burkholderia thailandensis]AWY66959.1 RNA-directed DNA polymerase [Burkholderia thailandensis]MCS6497827.1 reverse transcriptase domain-containing protein [Burkholderia thailandensis]
MAKNAYHTALSLDALRAAWGILFKKSSPRSRNTTGVDDISINDFRADEKARLNRLARDLHRRAFQFSDLRPHLIPKTSGKDRLICVPTVQDRIVQRALLNFLSDRYADRLANKISYGFVKDRGVKKAVHDACEIRAKYGWVYKADIASFFDSIERLHLERALKAVIRERSLHPLLVQAIGCEISATKGSVAKRINRLGIKAGRGVRQGMPLSPFFSNIMLAGFDRVIEQKSLRAVRYADDLIFFASSRGECEDAAEFCARHLAPIGLTVPPVELGSKSAIYEPDEAAEFLGVSLVRHTAGYRLELTQEQIDVIRDDLLKLGSVQELVTRGIALPKLGHVLMLRRNGYLAAYDMCHNVENLSRELGKLEQRVLRRIYSEGLGINIDKLSPAARNFLSLI